MSRSGFLAGVLVVASGFVVLIRSSEPDGASRDVVARPGEAPGGPGERGGARLESPGRAGTEVASPSAGSPATRLAPREPAAVKAPRSLPKPRQLLLGTLVSNDGPVAHAQVQLLSRGGTALSETTSDERGGFRVSLGRRPTEGVTLLARARGYAPLETGPYFPRAGERLYLGNLSLQRGRMLSGRVMDPAGTGIAGARVQLRQGGPSGGLNRHSQTATTGAEGRFRFPHAPGGPVRIEAFAEGFGSRSIDVHHSRSSDTVTVELVAARSLLIRVHEPAPSGAPVAGAVVLLRPRDPRSPEHGGTTNGEGRLVLEGLGTDVWEVRVALDTHRPIIQSDVTADGGELELVMERWPCIAGRITVGGGGAAPSGTTVTALASNARGGFVDTGRTAPVTAARDGAFRLCGLRPGVYAVEARARGFAPTRSDPVRLGLQDDIGGVHVQLGRGGRILVRVRAGGEPVEGALVEVFDAQPPGTELWRTDHSLQGPPIHPPVAVVPTTSGGEARLEHLAAGSYWCLVRSGDHVARLAGPFVAQEGLTTEPPAITLSPGGRLRGRVTDAGGHAPEGAIVVIFGEGEVRGPIQIATDADGRYRSPPLPPGTYRIGARLSHGPPGGSRAGPVTAVLGPEETKAVDVSF